MQGHGWNNSLILSMQTAASLCLQLMAFGVMFLSKLLLMTLEFGLFSKFINIEA